MFVLEKTHSNHKTEHGMDIYVLFKTYGKEKITFLAETDRDGEF
jgi:hypothetical protein